MHSLNLIHLSFHDSTSLYRATREEPPSLDATLAAIFMPTVRSHDRLAFLRLHRPSHSLLHLGGAHKPALGFPHRQCKFHFLH
ncbi:hypothetical protein OIU77_021627 [Salix suchowensis]|uniref:Uncharacterized protein n=1 Tax=Salix suchowensis TaxID=1278906 RepID=A0ABQ9CAK4_9ROSI|nr:hypothetical protein OIU77_021627 [Salix suchowensis]